MWWAIYGLTFISYLIAKKWTVVLTIDDFSAKNVFGRLIYDI